MSGFHKDREPSPEEQMAAAAEEKNRLSLSDASVDRAKRVFENATMMDIEGLMKLVTKLWKYLYPGENPNRMFDIQDVRQSLEIVWQKLSQDKGLAYIDENGRINKIGIWNLFSMIQTEKTTGIETNLRVVVYRLMRNEMEIKGSPIVLEEVITEDQVRKLPLTETK